MADCVMLQQRQDIFNTVNNIFVLFQDQNLNFDSNFLLNLLQKRRDFGAAGHSAPLWRGCLPERQESTEEGPTMFFVFSDLMEVR